MKLRPICDFAQARREVESLRDGDLPVDERIKNLVAALRMFGVQTFQSCEGHPPRKRGSRRPFVQTELAGLDLVARLVTHQNRLDRPGSILHNNQWVIHPTVHCLTIEPRELGRPLKVLQDGAEDFALTLRKLAKEKL